MFAQHDSGTKMYYEKSSATGGDGRDSIVILGVSTNKAEGEHDASNDKSSVKGIPTLVDERNSNLNTGTSPAIVVNAQPTLTECKRFGCARRTTAHNGFVLVLVLILVTYLCRRHLTLIAM